MWKLKLILAYLSKILPTKSAFEFDLDPTSSFGIRNFFFIHHFIIRYSSFEIRYFFI